MESVLYIDADYLAYTVSFRLNDYRINWGTGYEVEDSLFELLRDQVDGHIGMLLELTGAERYIIALGCNTEDNFRKKIMPSYKANRAKITKPEFLDDVKKYMLVRHSAVIIPNLEADDVIGIMATNPANDHKAIIVSPDKDMNTVPGYHLNPRKLDLGVYHVSKEDAYRFFIKQVLVGDSVDNYPGAPGIGEVRASRLLDGKEVHELWDIVLKTYKDKGRTEDDALRNARVAKILIYKDFDHDNNKIKLWTPRKKD